MKTNRDVFVGFLSVMNYCIADSFYELLMDDLNQLTKGNAEMRSFVEQGTRKNIIDCVPLKQPKCRLELKATE